LVILIDGRLSFDALQRRLVTSPAKVRQLVASAPASYVAFDLLGLAGVDLRTQRWANRRRRLESLAAWIPPLQVSLVTDNPAEAEQWFQALPAMGVEGLVAKGKASRYEPGRRGWLKVRHRDTVEVIVGGVLGPIDRPEVVIAGRYRGGELGQVGRTVPLSARQSADLGSVLVPAAARHRRLAWRTSSDLSQFIGGESPLPRWLYGSRAPHVAGSAVGMCHCCSQHLTSRKDYHRPSATRSIDQPVGTQQIYLAVHGARGDAMSRCQRGDGWQLISRA
jgi:ATP dependent DNA ligase domain